MIAPFGCGAQTGAGAVLNVLRPSTEESLAVFGVGSVGLAGLLAARAAGVDTIVAVDTSAPRRAAALALGASAALDPEADDVVQAIKELTGGGPRPHSTRRAFPQPSTLPCPPLPPAAVSLSSLATYK